MNTFLFVIFLLIVLILLGVPVAYSMGATAILYIVMVNPSFLKILPDSRNRYR